MTVFGTASRLVSWAKRCPRTRQSGKKATTGRTGKGNPYLNEILGEIAACASRPDTFLGERYRRIARQLEALGHTITLNGAQPTAAAP